MNQIKHSNKYEVGAILVNSWGWEQTNIEFYCIVSRNRDWVGIVPMSKKITEKEVSFMTNKVEPFQAIDSKPIRKKIKIYNGEESGFSLNGMGWCKLWDGKPVTESHYA